MRVRLPIVATKRIAKLLLVLVISACARNTEPYYGVWTGEAFYLEMNYEFSAKKFEASTITQNGLRVGGGSGTYIADDGRLTMHYDRKYVFDNRLNRGSWESDDKDIEVTFGVEGDRMRFDYVGTSQSIELTRQ